MGKLVAKRYEQYKWLPESLALFPGREELAEAFRQTGLQQVQAYPLTGGIDEWYEFRKSKEVGYKAPLNYGSTYGQILPASLMAHMASGTGPSWMKTARSHGAQHSQSQGISRDHAAVEQGRLAESGLSHRRFQSTDGKRDFRRYGRHDGFP